MEKKSKILITVIAIAAIAIPSTFFGIQFFIGSQINNAELTVEDIELLNLSDDQMIADVEFEVTTTSPIAVSFKIHNISMTYDDTILGNVSLSKNEFTTADTIYQTTITINITNSGLYLKLTEDFINETSLNLGVSGTVEFTGALSGLPSHPFSKEISITGLDKLSPTIQAINFENATEDTLDLEIIANLNNPSQLIANLSEIWVDIYYNSSYYVGNASATNVAFVSGTNQISLNATFGGSKTILSEILSNYIKGVNSSLTLDANITINFEGGSSNFDVEDTILFEFECTDTELISIDDISISIEVSFDNWFPTLPTQATIDVDIQITLHNPMSFIINVSDFQGKIYFDDTDGYNFGVGFSGDFLNHIYIDDVNFSKWNDNPLELPASGNAQDIATSSIDNLNLGLRLEDELIKDQLYVDIEDGVMDLQIGGFQITLSNLIFNNIYIPPT